VAFEADAFLVLPQEAPIRLDDDDNEVPVFADADNAALHDHVSIENGWLECPPR
jgi:hypothetical protein